MELYMKRRVPVESASALIDELIAELTDWRGKTLASIRKSILEADREIIEEWKWMGSPVWSATESSRSATPTEIR
jgi:hypothetical protein